MLVLKMMHENPNVTGPDDSPFKLFDLIQVPERFIININALNGPDPQHGHRFEVNLVDAKTGETQHYSVFGNVYVMNENGKTIASHGC